MPFTIQIKLASNELLVQQNTDCLLILTNVGSGKDEASHPGTSPWSLVFRVTEIKTGIDSFFKPERKPFDQDRKIAFNAGQADQVVVPLLMKASFPGPGEYEVSALWSWGPAKPAESNAVRVKIHPFTARNLSLNRVEYAAFSAAVLNVATDPPVLLRAGITLLPGGGVQRLDPVAPVNLRTVGVLSQGPNQTIMTGEWMAWIDGKKLSAAYVDSTTGSSAVRSVAIGEGDYQIVAPLYCAAPPDDGSRPTGAGLLSITATGRAVLQAFNLTPAAIQPGASATLASPPLWIESRVLSSGRRFVCYCTAEANRKLALYCMPWPGEPNFKPGAAVKLCEWSNMEFVGGTLIIDQEDQFLGGLLMWNMSNRGPTLEFINWKAVPAGHYEELTRRQIQYSHDAGISRAIVRLFQSGFFAALLKDNSGRWMVWDPIHGETRIAPPLDTSPLPLDLAMIKTDEPILVSGTIGSGLKFSRTDGTVLKFKPK